MNGKQLRQALRAGTRVYGMSVTAPTAFWPVALANAGLDFVFLDTEHVPEDRMALAWMCQTYHALGVAPIVRIPRPDPYQACMVIDAGAAGVIAPYVETVEEVLALAGAAKLRPIKGKRLTDKLEGRAPLEPNLQEYLDKRNEGISLIVNIESVPAIQNLDALLAVEELDAVIIGPHDMTCNLGIPEEYRNPIFLDAVKTVTQKTRNAGKGAGIHFWDGLDLEIQWLRDGLNMLVHSTDITLVTQALKRELAHLRAALGDGAAPQGGGEDPVV